MVKKRDRGIRYFILSTSVILLVLLIIGVFSGALFSDQIKLSGGGSVNNVNLVLSKDKFGSNENLKGSLTIDHTGELDLDEEVTFEVLECSSYAKRKFSLFQVLNGTGLTSEEVSSFARGNSSSSYTASNNNLVGFYYEGVPNNVEFNINGNANFLKLDFGNDGSEDWGFSGERTGWGTEIKPNTICSDYSGTSEFNPHTTINQNLVFNYFGTANEIDLKLNVVAKVLGLMLTI